MSPRPSPLAAAAKVLCNRIWLEPKRKAYGLPLVHERALAIGTVLSQPLRPAMPDESPHPLRHGWFFEASPPEHALPSLRATAADFLVECPALPEGS